MFEFIIKRKLMQSVLFFAAGILLCAFLSLWAIIAPLIVIAFALKKRERASLYLLSAFLLFGVLRFHLSASHSPHDVALIEVPLTAKVVGWVANDPVVKTFKDYRNHERKYSRMIIKAESLNGSPCKGLVQTTIYGCDNPPIYGTKVEIRGELKEPKVTDSPGVFDYSGYLKIHGIERLLLSSSPGLTIIENPKWNLLTTAAYIRRSFKHFSTEVLPTTSAQLVGGLLLGIQSDIPDDIKDDLRTIGGYHLLSVSGFHVGALWWVVFFSLLKAGMSRKTAATIIIPCLACYSLVTGGDSPVVRSSIMLALYSSAFIFKREPDWLTALSTAALGYLIYDPQAIFNISFQLSFVSMAGLSLWTQPMERWMFGWTDKYVRYDQNSSDFKDRVINFFRKSISMSVVGTISSAPLVAYYFHETSILGPLSNLFLGLLTVAIYAVFLPIWLIWIGLKPVGIALVTLILAPLLNIFLQISHYLSLIPGAMIYLPSMHWWLAAAFYILMFVGASDKYEK